MHRLVATFFGVGRFPLAPGTTASLVAVAVGAGLHLLGGILLLALAATCACIGGLWASARYLSEASSHDPPEIVIDEVAGQWIALLPVPYFAPYTLPNSLPYLLGATFASFMLFRLFDIWKPSLIGRADKLDSPLSVMLDDILAGLASAIILALLSFTAIWIRLI